MKVNRNDPCPCGSGKKYKKCCLRTATDPTGYDLLSIVGQLQPLIEDFGRQRYGASTALAAWKDFSRWGRSAIARDEQAYEPAFATWHLFAWLPDDADLGEQSFNTPPSDHAIAFDYLKANRDSLSQVELDVIEVGTKSPYGFYSIIAVVLKNRLQVQEIYTGQTLMVDGVATMSHAQGDVLFTAVLSVNGTSVLLGCLPQPLDSSAQVKVAAHREKWRAEEGKAIDQRLLYLHDTELRRFYFTLLNQAQRVQLH